MRNPKIHGIIFNMMKEAITWQKQKQKRVNTVNRYIGKSIIARKPITRCYRTPPFRAWKLSFSDITIHCSTCIRFHGFTLQHFDSVWIFVCLCVLTPLSANCNQTLVEWSLDGPLPICVRWSRLPTNMAAKLKIEKRGGWNFNCPLLL